MCESEERSNPLLDRLTAEIAIQPEESLADPVLLALSPILQRNLSSCDLPSMSGTIFPLEQDNEMTPKPSKQQIEHLYLQQDPAAQRLLTVNSTALEERATSNRRIRWSVAELGPTSKRGQTKDFSCGLEDPFTSHESDPDCVGMSSARKNPFASHDSSEDSSNTCVSHSHYPDSGYVSKDEKLSPEEECEVEDSDNTSFSCCDLEVRDKVHRNLSYLNVYRTSKQKMCLAVCPWTQ